MLYTNNITSKQKKKRWFERRRVMVEREFSELFITMFLDEKFTIKEVVEWLDEAYKREREGE